jgi:hypothetical protein
MESVSHDPFPGKRMDSGMFSGPLGQGPMKNFAGIWKSAQLDALVAGSL